MKARKLPMFSRVDWRKIAIYVHWRSRRATEDAAWRKEYNEKRPHRSLGYRTPHEFAQLSRGKDGDTTALENAGGNRPPAFPIFPPLRRRLRGANL